MKLKLWGVRGSMPVAGKDKARHGGNTSCVEVRGREGHVLVLDAGTGIRDLGTDLLERLDDPDQPDVHRIDLLLTHLHLDHIQGLGFFAPLRRPEMEIHIWGPRSKLVDPPSSSQEQSLRERLKRYLSPPLFPTMLSELPCTLVIEDFPRDGSLRFGTMEVKASFIDHATETYGYRITEDDHTVCYLPDHKPAELSHLERWSASWQEHDWDPDSELCWISGISLAHGADVLIHDAQFDDEEFVEHPDWGHSSMSHAMIFGMLAEVGMLIPFHHDPEHDDERIERMVTEARSRVVPEDSVMEIEAACEGRELDVAKLRAAAQRRGRAADHPRSLPGDQGGPSPPVAAAKVHVLVEAWR